MPCSNRTYYFESHESIEISLTTWLCIIGTPVLVMIGISGNFVSFLVFRRRALRSASHFYFCALVVTDSLTLVFGFLVEAWLREYVKEGVLKSAYLRLHAARKFNGSAAAEDYLPEAVRAGTYSYLCLPSVFLRTAAQTASVYLLITFTATRTLVIVHPLQSAVWATVSTAKKCVAAVVGGSLLIGTCTTAYHAFARLCDPLVASDILDLIFLSFVPSIALLVFNCVIVSTIYRREHLAAPVPPAAPAAGGSSRNRAAGRVLHVGGITRRLILVTVAFILLEMPLSVCKVYIHLNDLECLPHGYFYKDVERALRLLSNVNYSVNFLLYCLSGEQFRRALLLTLRCRQPSFSLIRRALKQPPLDLHASRRKRARTRPFTSSLPHHTIAVPHQLRVVSPYLANVQTIDAEMQLELEADEIEYFNIAVEHGLDVLRTPLACLRRYSSLPAFVRFELHEEHEHPKKDPPPIHSKAERVSSNRKRSHSFSTDHPTCLLRQHSNACNGDADIKDHRKTT